MGWEDGKMKNKHEREKVFNWEGTQMKTNKK